MEENNEKRNRRKEDKNGYKLIILGKYAAAILSISALVILAGSQVWAKKDDVNLHLRKIQNDIAIIKNEIQHIKRKVMP
jgi:hypothetical protein